MEQKQENPIMKDGKLNVELPNDETIIKYSNLVIVSHMPEEFVMDFSRLLNGQNGAKVVSRVIMTPKNVKMFAKVLNHNIENYEKKFGEIPLPENPITPNGVVQ